MTNADRIRRMTDEELAKFLEDLGTGDIETWHGFCDICNGFEEKRCWECMLYWLKMEAEENDAER